MVIHRRTFEKVQCDKQIIPKIEENIGHGTFGQIFIARDKDNNRVAVKKFTYSKDPIHLTTIRELKALKQIKSDFILPILDIFVSNCTVHMVMPLYEWDLYKLIQKEALSLFTVKEIFYQIVRGVQDIHKAGFIHRDIKSANILLKKIATTVSQTKKVCPNDRDSKSSQSDRQSNESEALTTELESNLDINDKLETMEKRKVSPHFTKPQCQYEVKICDFGISKSRSSNMTPDTVTLWYRAPEILLGSTAYGGSVDVWSLGCILLEFLAKKAIFSHDNEIDVLFGIIDLCGSINEDTFIGCSLLPMFNKYKLIEGKNKIKEKFAHLSAEAADLAFKMLSVDPSKRITVAECLEHPFFDEVKNITIHSIR